jgi:hypothetical protein
MAGFGGFLQGVGLAAGRNVIYGQEFAQKQANLEETQNQVQLQKFQLGQLAQQQQTQKDVGDFIGSELQKDASNVTDPVKTAQMYQKAAGIALRDGDFTSADNMSKLAKSKLDEAKQAAVLVQQQQQQRKEDLANAAGDFSTNPTAEGGQALVQKAVAAGVNPTTIPQPGTPAFKTWANQQQLASKSASERADFVEKANENAERMKEKREEHADNVALRLEQMRATAANQAANRELREAMAADRRARAPEVKDINGSQYQYDPTGTVKGDRDTPDPGWVKIGEKMTSQQKTGVSRGSYAAAEVSRSLGKVLQFDPGTTTGPFANLGAHTPLEAMLKVGSNQLTPAQYQSMNVNAAGLGNQIASLESALGGRMAAGTQQQHLQDMAVPQPGDSGYTAAYKIANAKELTVTALKHLPGNFANTPQGKAQIEELEKSIPFSTDGIIKLMKKDPQSKKSEAAIRQLTLDSAKAKENIAEATPGIGASPVPSAAPAGASVPGLPSGWSVKEH